MAFNTTLPISKAVPIRRAAMLKVEKDNQTHLALIHKYLLVKYILKDSFTRDQLSESQIQTLKIKIKSKECHKRLFKVCEYELADVEQLATWLTCGNIKPRDENSLCFLQDRNVLFGEQAVCSHCKTASKTVYHLATKYDRMLDYDYNAGIMEL